MTFRRPVILLAACALLGCNTSPTTSEPYDVVVRGGRVIDPESGLDAIRNLGIRDGRIGQISANVLVGEQVIDANGLVVAPGFIDLHAHGQAEEPFRLMVQDGVTTAFEIELGTSDVSAWYGEREGGQILNYAVGVGHVPVRMRVMGDEGIVYPTGSAGSEQASEEQITEMEALIERGLREGAVAVGFGLAYTPAAVTAELESMLQIAADHGASAYIHVRGTSSLNPDPTLQGLNEAIAAAAKTGASLHVAHANSSGGPFTIDFIRVIELARNNGQDVTTEAYPYEAGMTRIESALFDGWESWEDDRFAILEWTETSERLTRASFARYRSEGGTVIIHSRTEEMTRAAIENPLTMIASDGFIENGHGHPRTSGTFSKVLGKYVREKGALTLMDALRKMTIDPARRLEGYVPAMQAKGRLSLGADADIVLFDPESVIDRSTYSNPSLPSDGIQYVLINGIVVVERGELVPNVAPGRAIRAPGTPQ
jgi:N-acyl-D-aspartate/D-glutamate deacylase